MSERGKRPSMETQNYRFDGETYSLFAEAFNPAKKIAKYSIY